VNTDEIRTAIQAHIDRTSLRQVAREIGMSPSGLDKFVAGSKPYPKTLRKLKGWYRRHSGPGEYEAELDALLARLGLAPGTREELRAQLSAQIVAALGSNPGAGGAPASR